MADLDDELTELIDPDFPRIDLVGRPASGVPRFLIAKQDADAAGLLDAEFVRELIGKQAEPEPEPADTGQVTMTGSPAAMAEMLARVRKGAPQAEDVAKAKNDTADRKHKAATGAAMPDGSYPIANESDLTKAIHAVGRGGSSHDAIRKHIISRARSLGASSKIPDNWNSDGSLKSGVSKEAGVPDAVTKADDMGPDLDGGVDGMDPTVALAEPDEMGPGDMTDPGSPAWESIDAATAQKWTSIAVRLKNALCIMAEREMLEAASADPDDCENAFDLEDAMCAVDYVIDTLAGFAVDEQAEADLGGEAMEAVGKSAADAGALAAIAKAMADEAIPAALTTVETFGAVIRKSGRVLSSVNETHIREAAARLNTVLSSLPQAPTADDGQPVAKMTPELEAGMPKPALSEDATAAAGQEPAMGTAEPPPAAQEAVVTKAADETPGARQEAAEAVAKSALALVYDRDRCLAGVVNADAIVTQVAKADDGEKKPMQAVFDQDGDLIGIVDPDAIQPVTGAGGKPAPDDSAADGGDAAPAADDSDMTPAPAAETGTPAGAVDDDGTVAKSSTQDVYAALESVVAKAVAAALDGRTPAEDIAKQADVAGLLEEVETLKARLATVEETPAAPKVFTNGQTPPAHQLRGQDQGAPPQIDVAKAAQMKREMYTADPADATRIANELQQSAIDQLAAMHATRR